MNKLYICISPYIKNDTLVGTQFNVENINRRDKANLVETLKYSTTFLNLPSLLEARKSTNSYENL